MFFSLVFNLILIIYPLDQTYFIFKKPKLALCLHWCIWWFLFSSFLIGESIYLNYLPFWQIIKLLILVPNYSPLVSSWTLDVIKIGSKRIKNHSHGKKIINYWHQIKEYIFGFTNKLYNNFINSQFNQQINVQSN